MKGLFALALAMVLSLAITSCSSNPDSSTSTVNEGAGSEASEEFSSSEAPDAIVVQEGQSSSSAGSSLFSGAKWVENETTSGVPTPSFSVPAEAVDVTDSESFGIVNGHWVGVPDDEIRAYVLAVKDAGFTTDATESSTETSYMYSARDRADYKDYRIVSISLSSVKSTSGEMSEPRLSIDVTHHHLDFVQAN
jgi:hypothetical protein